MWLSAALMLCFSICNRFVSLRKQIVQPMHDRYVQLQQEYDEYQKALKAHRGPPALVFDFRADLQTISAMKLPTEILERHVFEKISISGRALAAAVDLVGAIDGLDRSIKLRNNLIEEIQKASFPHKELLEKYLGLRTAADAIDEKFCASVDAIYRQTEDCIFFSRILADDLFEYGKKLRRRYAWKFRLGTPKLSKADWSMSERAGLIPTTEQYAAWLKGFRKTPTKLGRLTAWIRSCYATARG
jgi:hypothetical protein